MERTGILLVSFGTTSAAAGEKSIGRLERALRVHFPECPVVSAYTSMMVRRILKERQGMVVPGPAEALDELLAAGVSKIRIFPDFLLRGIEYEKMEKQVEAWRASAAEARPEQTGHPEETGRSISVVICRPLLDTKEDVQDVLELLLHRIAPSSEEILILMGHGTGHEADFLYTEMNEILQETGHGNVFIATVEGEVRLEDLFPKLQGKKKVILTPFLLSAGVHVMEDLAGDAPSSWKSMLQDKGYPVEVVPTGLLEYDEVAELCIRRVEECRGE